MKADIPNNFLTPARNSRNTDKKKTVKKSKVLLAFCIFTNFSEKELELSI